MQQIRFYDTGRPFSGDLKIANVSACSARIPHGRSCFSRFSPPKLRAYNAKVPLWVYIINDHYRTFVLVNLSVAQNLEKPPAVTTTAAEKRSEGSAEHHPPSATCKFTFKYIFHHEIH